jgi:hypothetical protein
MFASSLVNELLILAVSGPSAHVRFRSIADIRDYARTIRDRDTDHRQSKAVESPLGDRPSSKRKDRPMNRPTIPLLAATVSVALIVPSNVSAALLQTQPKVQVVAPPDPNAPPVAVVEPPDPNAPRVAVVPPPQPGAPPAFAILPPKPGLPAVAVVPPATAGAPPALAVIPPDPNAPPVAVVPPPGGEVRVVIPVAANAVAALPDCSSSVMTHCVLNRKHSSR